MKVKLSIGDDTTWSVETNAKGEPVALIITPAFSSSKGTVTVATGECLSDSGKNQFDRFGLVVSGQTGKLKKIDKSLTVRAAVDVDDEQPFMPALESASDADPGAREGVAGLPRNTESRRRRTSSAEGEQNSRE